MNKGLTITLITLLSILLICVIGFMIYLINGNVDITSFRFSINESKKLVDEKEIYSIKDLSIDTNNVDILVNTDDNYTNSIKIELYSNSAEEYEITENDTNIKIVLKEKNVFSIGRKQGRVKIYVPKSYDKNIDVNSITGDVSIDELSNSNLNVTLKTGDIKVKSINDGIITCTTGDINIDYANSLDITLKTGDIEIINANDIKIVGTTGDVDIDSVLNVNTKITTGDIKVGEVNSYLHLTSSTGDINVEKANIQKNSIIKSGIGDVKVRNTTGCYIDAYTKVGDTKVTNNDRKSDILLTITSKIGDIKVN